MIFHAQRHHWTKGILLMLLAVGTLSGCEEKVPPQEATGSALTAKPVASGSEKAQTNAEEFVDALDIADDTSKKHKPDAPAAGAGAEVVEQTSQLRQTLLQRGWREAPAEDGGTYLLPPQANR